MSSRYRRRFRRAGRRRTGQTVPDVLAPRLQQWIKRTATFCSSASRRWASKVYGDDEQPAGRPAAARAGPPYRRRDLFSGGVRRRAPAGDRQTAGLVVHPAAGNWSGTLLNGLLHHAPARPNCRALALCTGWTKTPAARWWWQNPTGVNRPGAPAASAPSAPLPRRGRRPWCANPHD